MLIPKNKILRLEVDTPEMIAAREQKEAEAKELAEKMRAEGKVLYKGKWVTEAEKAADEAKLAEAKKKRDEARAAAAAKESRGRGAKSRGVSASAAKQQQQQQQQHNPGSKPAEWAYSGYPSNPQTNGRSNFNRGS